MCGIVGALTDRPVAPILLDALRRLEYRGYDSAGIAAIDSGTMDRRRACGKLSALAELLGSLPLSGSSGIGHTRWATHGSPSVANAHPHRAGPVAVVHNGIIENYFDLRTELAQEGWTFDSETDSEVIATLCAAMLRRGLGREDAAAAALSRLKGTYALCLMFEGQDNLIICARRGSPLVIGHGDNEMFVGSDAIALAPLTDRITYLEEGDWAVLTRSSVRIHDASGQIVQREVHVLSVDSIVIDKGPYRHFMAKEIHEQPTVAARALGVWIAKDRQRIDCPAEAVDWSSVPRLTMVACGTAYLAACVARTWFEQLANCPVEIDIASEFRYREPPLPAGGVTLVVSQSGETADTLAALRYAKARGQTTLALVNVTTSTIAREADIVLATHAGPEIGVASTKAFTAQLLGFAALAVMVARKRGAIDAAEEQRLVDLLSTVPRLLAEALKAEPALEALAQEIADAGDVLFLGRGIMYPMALEGALKLKEITYIHAEGYAAGELKHGPIALVDETLPVIALAPCDALFDKVASNLQEVVARRGRVALLTDSRGAAQIGTGVWRTVVMPTTDPFLQVFTYAVAVQLIAYHTAVAKGTDVDQPRNLAKSVTVE
jgi:glucosamine--fructose-6-phosphate aminotransferase (isomerizing)